MTWGNNMEIHHQLDTMVGVSIYQFLSPKMAIDIRTGGVPSETNHDKSKTKQTVCTVLQFELFKSVQFLINNSKGNPEKQQHSDISDI